MLCCILLLALVSAARSAEICCPGLQCFNDDWPFDHMDLPYCPEDLDIEMILYTPENREGVYISRNSIPSVGGSQKLAFFIHGYNGNGGSWYTRMGDALLDKGVWVVTVEWWSYNVYYPQPATDTRSVGAEVGLMAENMVAQGGATSGNLWCIGHSLGAHACGFAGKRHTLGRITGMDPAGPMFEGYTSWAHLTSTDADLVDVLHTNIYVLGYTYDMGDVDFYPNGGEDMPGCDTWGCSHNRCYDYLIESIRSQCPFTATSQCTDYEDIPGSCSPCDGGVCQYMGYRADTHQGRGIFHLTTNPSEPFCQG